MIISIDTEKMGTISANALQVNTEIDACVAALIPVVEHNDWNCKERDVINDGIVAVRTNVRKLQEDVLTFSSKVKQVADMFNAFEASIPNRYQGLEALLGNVFSEATTPAATVQHAGGGVQDALRIVTDFNIKGNLENNALRNLTNHIQLCEFSEVEF